MSDTGKHGVLGGDVSGEAHEHPYEVIAGNEHAPVFLTCEHASERVPAPWRLSERDARLFGTHWAYDLGAAEMTRELAHELEAPAVLSHFTRLLVDPNRPEDADTLFRTHADGLVIELNRAIDPDERERRLRDFYRPYHRAVDRGLARTRCPIALAVHTFTPLYEGTPRPMELGVLFDEEVELAESMAEALRAAGFIVAMNLPYSGRDGLMYSVERHALAHGRRPIEIEVRQDLATHPNQRRRVVQALAEWARTPCAP